MLISAYAVSGGAVLANFHAGGMWVVFRRCTAVMYFRLAATPFNTLSTRLYVATLTNILLYLGIANSELFDTRAEYWHI